MATGLEKEVALHSGMVVRADKAGTITYADAERIKVDEREYVLRKFVGLKERTCLNQKPDANCRAMMRLTDPWAEERYSGD